ncbi:hypothetical protein HaloA020_29230 [Halomonas sp. A020]|uniref:hypothetical protein n=1 Tax=Halomonas sp. A020 TaxID=2717374 RepID=UPI002490E0E3|nr:hypothetical protein [Halomonas sp. A020]BCB62222.1 hypothetical protein HaloA020_29230 [Halomonas sp. A020]
MSFEQAVVQLEQTNAALQEEVVRFRDAAMGLSAIYPTITEGRQNTADGKYFSVPGSGAYMRLYRRSGSTASLIAEFPDRAQVQGIVDVFGGRGVTGPGDLMAQGAFGLGGQGYQLSDFNAAPSANQFYFGAGAPGSNDLLGAKYWPGVDLYRLSSGHSIRLMFSNLGAVIRGWVGGSPSFDFKLLHDKNILGAVSQSGGVPTGAVIERGSNANGDYVKFADGTLICFLRGTFPSGVFSPLGALFSTPSINVSFPAAFISNPVVSLGSSFGASGTWAGLGDSGTSNNSTSLRAYRTSAVTVSNLRYEVIAIGRWY